MPREKAIVKGRERHIRRLKRLTSEAERMATRVVYTGADMIAAAAKQSITAGSISGKNHVPSSPGQPPNNDTGHLAKNIEVETSSPLQAKVLSKAAYANALEFGSSKMSARPYMRPARDAKRKEIQKLFAAKMAQLVKESGK